MFIARTAATERVCVQLKGQPPYAVDKDWRGEEKYKKKLKEANSKKNKPAAERKRETSSTPCLLLTCLIKSRFSFKQEEEEESPTRLSMGNL